jgi:hypothetical protein
MKWRLGVVTTPRLWAQPVKRTKPSDLLASIYGWVTEGFDGYERRRRSSTS